MPLVNMRDMLQHAYQHGYAVGAFDLVSLDFLQGVISAAERCDAPVILKLSASTSDCFDAELVLSAAVTAAKRTGMPVAIHLDKNQSFNSAVTGINRGCNGVMIDYSHQALTENLKSTRRVVDMAHACGIPVEGKLGCAPGADDGDTERHAGEATAAAALEAKFYVEKTGVDFLAVSTGTARDHDQANDEPDYLRLQAINDEITIPLVIDGNAGLSDGQYQQLINRGVSKINYDRPLADVAGLHIRENAHNKPLNGYTGLTDGVQETIRAEVARCINLWGSARRAREVIACCEAWSPVEHLIIYNVKGITDDQTTEMIQKGKSVLSTIPGVLEVVTGQAVPTEAAYRYAWLIRFCHRAVIESYRNHPLHVAFADSLFRPVAGERISIDYQTD